MTGPARQSDFWSRRRAAVRAEAEAEEAVLRAEEAEVREAEAAERTDEEILAELGLPDPDTMVQGDDFSAFLKSAVPERLRRRALRRLWRSNPVLANLDGLIDHGEDFTDKAVVVPGMMTTYQVGKGMLRHVMALAEANAHEDKDKDKDDDVPASEEFDAPVSIDEELADEPEELVAAEPEPVPQPRRHMRFSFADTETPEIRS
ncbi:DUF3306 domain-containing protein [Defluviimonas sp. WL0050]|uniref:DUF3306 domain-containing protein n=1 Tax=Albidovulum litorale TaxID=2984134 RepID=A0ABT2ZIB3_9RHOB|nr:DUF3306 domain-containing protein [Defluviimonas sp. WL0050]MCV2870863.1 DUF3306 domain-containing protein [Defluviimonas sp. WL0050]